MLLWIVTVVFALALLVWGADRFVVGAAATARNLGVSPLIIGLTVVGIGTSAPEILVSITASLQGNPALAVGNAVGSNIANVGLVLGTAALIGPLAVSSGTLKREFPIMFMVMALAFVLLLDYRLDTFDGIVLLLGLVALMGTMVVVALKARRGDRLATEYEHEIPGAMSNARALLWIAVGLVVLLASARAIVWGSVNIARALEVSDLLIGLTIVAVGTSLPELAASVVSVLKKESDIAIGNVIGSNMFNLLPVLAVPGILAPGEIPAIVVYRDYVIMFGLSAVLFALAVGVSGPRAVQRSEGALLLFGFFAYQAFLYVSAN
ncbi:MAG: calcium/sodium antiporter [Gammaproteobacteria bacterium]|nr:MAG: calcium/sodium antiporter [Gammaproteobacteria bacterium]